MPDSCIKLTELILLSLHLPTALPAPLRVPPCSYFDQPAQFVLSIQESHTTHFVCCFSCAQSASACTHCRQLALAQQCWATATHLAGGLASACFGHVPRCASHFCKVEENKVSSDTRTECSMHVPTGIQHQRPLALCHAVLPIPAKFRHKNLNVACTSPSRFSISLFWPMPRCVSHSCMVAHKRLIMCD